MNEAAAMLDANQDTIAELKKTIEEVTAENRKHEEALLALGSNSAELQKLAEQLQARAAAEGD